MTVNWDDLVRDAGDVGSGNFEPIPEGDYDFEVLEVKSKTAKNGKKMFEVKSKVVGGAQNGRFIWDNVVLTTDNQNALGFFFRKMAAMGLPKEYFSQAKPSDEQICATLKGRQFRAKVGHRLYNGDKKPEIKTYYVGQPSAAVPPSVPGAPPMPPPAAAPAAPAPPPAAAAPAPAPAPAPQAPPAPPVQDPWAAQAPAQPANPADPWATQAPPPAPAPAPAEQPPAAAAPATPPAPPAAPPAAPEPAQAAAPAGQTEGAPAVPPPPPSPF